MTQLHLGAGEGPGLAVYLERLLRLDDRAAVRLQASGRVLGVWSGPPFDVVALRPAALAAPADLDVTVSARRLSERLPDAGPQGATIEVPDVVTGPSWVGLLPPRSGWEERARTSVAQVRSAVDSAVHFFRLRSQGVTGRGELDAIAADVWQRACVGEVPVRCAHAAELLGLLGPDDGEVVAYRESGWLRLQTPGGSVACRRETTVGLGLLFGPATVDR
jgi:hypothetical protein